MIVVISVGGIFFRDTETLKEVAAAIDEVERSHHDIYVVAGGGVSAREYIKIAREFGANETFCDYIGIAVTRINAKLLISALKDAYPEPFLDYREAAMAKVSGGTELIAVMGGVSPGYTTDTVAAILAEYVNADLLLYLTSVDGVYEADPRQYPGARKYARVTPQELVAITMKEVLKAGSRIVIDPVAAKIIERSRIKTIVTDRRGPHSISDAIEGKHYGTEIRPDARSAFDISVKDM